MDDKVRIERRDVSAAAQLADLYASQMLECPYEYEITGDSFRDAVCQPIDGLSDQLLLVAIESNHPVAFAHIGRGAVEGQADVGAIRSLIVPRGGRSHVLGQALLDAAHEHLSEAGLRSCHIGSHSYPCTRVSPVRTAWDQICSLLEENDYSLDLSEGRWHVMEWRDMDLVEPILPVPEMRVEVGGAQIFPDEPNHGRAPKATVRVFRDDELVGSTEAMIWHVPHWHANPQDVCVTEGLGVSEDERRRGIGRYLMKRSLWEMKLAGCRHALLGVLESNEPAIALYESMGYRTIYSACAMIRDL